MPSPLSKYAPQAVRFPAACLHMLIVPGAGRTFAAYLEHDGHEHVALHAADDTVDERLAPAVARVRRKQHAPHVLVTNHTNAFVSGVINYTIEAEYKLSRGLDDGPRMRRVWRSLESGFPART